MSEIAERAAREIHGDCTLCEIYECVSPDCKPQVDQDAAIVERAIAESRGQPRPHEGDFINSQVIIP